MTQKRHAVLLVDDSSDDRFFMKLAMERSTTLYVAAEVCDGQEAIDYLQGTEPFQDRAVFPWPDLVLLDLSMPRKNGFEVLQWIQKQPARSFLVAIVSGSFLEQDITKSMRMGANRYFQKTPIKREQDEIVGLLEQLVEESPLSSSISPSGNS